MISLGYEAKPEYRTLGSYFKFGYGPVVHAEVHPSLMGCTTYFADSYGHVGSMVAIELTPGLEDVQDAGKNAIVGMLQRNSSLDEAEAEWILDRLIAGRSGDA